MCVTCVNTRGMQHAHPVSAGVNGPDWHAPCASGRPPRCQQRKRPLQLQQGPHQASQANIALWVGRTLHRTPGQNARGRPGGQEQPEIKETGSGGECLCKEGGGRVLLPSSCFLYAFKYWPAVTVTVCAPFLPLSPLPSHVHTPQRLEDRQP